MFATHEKEEKLTPVTARLGFESSGVKRSSHDASHDAVSKIDTHSLRRALAEWMIADGLPFYAIEGRGFHNLMNLLRPDSSSSRRAAAAAKSLQRVWRVWRLSTLYRRSHGIHGVHSSVVGILLEGRNTRNTLCGTEYFWCRNTFCFGCIPNTA